MVQQKRAQMKIQDMTEGSPIKHILIFTIPLLIGSIFQQIYSVVDTMIAGYNLGDPAIAAIGASAPLYGLIFSAAFGMNNGFGIVVTRHFGARKEKEMKQAIAGMIFLNTLIAVVLTILSVLFLRPLMVLMNTPASIFDDAYSYIFIVCAGMIATVYYNMFSAILRAVGNSRTPLYFLLLATVLNILLDVLLIMVIPLGLAGAAWATIIAQAVSAILSGVYTWKNYKDILPSKEELRINTRIYKDLLSTGFAMALMLCVVDIGTVIFQSANNMLGELYIASYTAARRIINLTMQPLATVATAMSTFVAQNWGAQKVERIRSSFKKVCLLEILLAAIMCVVAYGFGGAIIQFTTGTKDAQIISNAVLSLRLHVSFYAPLGILFCLRTSMQSMEQKVAPVISSCIELAMKIFSAVWLIPNLGFLGTCLTEPVTWVFMVTYLGIVYICQRKKLYKER